VGSFRYALLYASLLLLPASVFAWLAPDLAQD